MKVIALGGSGGMGRHALSVFAEEIDVDEVIVADIDQAAAAEAARELVRKGCRATGRHIDVEDGVALRKLMREGDLVMNSVGPYFRFGLPTLEAAIDTKRHYIDICDDADPTIDMFALDARAREAGITAIVGAGASPGFMNMMAKAAATGLDRVDDITVGWTVNNSGRGWDLMRGPRTGGLAATVHFFAQFTGTVPVCDRRDVVEQKTREPISIDVPGLGRGTAYAVGHPEPLTLTESLNAHGRAISVCMLGSDRAALLDDLAVRVERSELSLEEAAVELRANVHCSTPHPNARLFADSGDLPTYFVVLTGRQNSRHVTRYAGCLSKPEAMTLGTGVPYGVATALFASDPDSYPAGVHALDSVLASQPFFEKVARRWGVSNEDLFFTGTVSTDVSPATETRSI